jgi:spore coat protein U-like protein
MSSGGNYLYFQISNNTSCSGGVGDNPISENTAIPLTTGVASFNICAAVITGGQNTGAVAGSYSDTVTYTIAP